MTEKTRYKRIAQLRTANDFRSHLAQLGIDLAFDEVVESGPDAPLAQPFQLGEWTIGNRFAVLPMEGWDGTTDGHPTELTRRRWARFGQSGAKLVCGGEAVAVRADGRASPNQLMITENTIDSLVGLRELLVQTHAEHHHRTDDLIVGLQLTHSGRFARPYDRKLQPRTLYHHPLLDLKFKVESETAIMSDDEIDTLVQDFVNAATLAAQAGFHFVDIKHCHGYLGHEFLSAIDREGRYGGSFENRTRFLRNIVAGIRKNTPELAIGVRLSAFDWIPFRPDEEGYGTPEGYDNQGYPYAFGSDSSGTGIDLTEPLQFLELLRSLNINLVCITAGSPYYVPHIQRPALFPPSDGYLPPEDPLIGVARQIDVVHQLKQSFPNMSFVGSGYSYLQEWVPNVAQAVVRNHMTDFVGLGRLMLSYPDLPSDVLAGRELKRKLLCRTFSDCTTGPRNGLSSGCYPLDEFYKNRPEYNILMEAKKK